MCNACVWYYVVFGNSISALRLNTVSNNGIIFYMTIQEWAGLTLTILSIVAIFGVGARWIIKTYVSQIMAELKPNGGGSMKDQVTRLEDRMNEADFVRRSMSDKLDKMYLLLIDHIADVNSKKKSKPKI